MQDQVNERADRIRASVRDAKAKLTAVAERLSDARFKQMVRGEASRLDDIEPIFIAPAFRQPQHVPPDVWLGYAETWLAAAVQQRKVFEELISKYGVNAKLVG